MIFGRFTEQGRRDRAKANAPDGPVREYYDAPLPDKDTPVRELPLLTIDLETTGLDPTRDHIISIGFAPIDSLGIVMEGARHMLVKPECDIGQSAVFHGITHDQLEHGLPVTEALTRTLDAVKGRLVVAHHARIERDFIAAACRNVFGVDLTLPVVDTMKLHRYLLRRAGASDESLGPDGNLRLQRARDRYNLPRYPAHDALLDAISAGELFLAQAAELSTTGKIRAETLRKLSA